VREGLETVLFLTPLLTSDAIATLDGMPVGILTAVLLAYAIFVVGVRINLHRFFHVTSIMLILLISELAGSGTHEPFEYGEKAGIEGSWLAQPVYTLSIPKGSLIPS
jgi:high-affinity iron transporter